MGKIKEGIFNTLEALFAKWLTPEEVTLDGLKGRLLPFFSEVRTFVQIDFENVSTFSSIIQSTQEAIEAWRKSCIRQEQTITILEFQLNLTPSISMREVEAVLARFIDLQSERRTVGARS